MKQLQNSRTAEPLIRIETTRELKVQLISIKHLLCDPRNPRTHSDAPNTQL